MELNVDGVEVEQIQCSCQGDLFAVYTEEDVEVNLEAIASQLGLSGRRKSTDTKVIGQHETTCPFCGMHLTFGEMVRMKLAGILFGWPEDT